MELRNRLYDLGIFKAHRLPVPVIAVGNLTVGGTGKTPLTIAIVRGLRARHPSLRIGVLSRGYGRTNTKAWIVSDGRKILMDARESGDEPQMMARCLPDVGIFVGSNRVNIARKALARFPLDVLILDDAYQHRRIHRDINILCVDGEQGLRGKRVLPSGPLREFPWNMKRATCLAITRYNGRIPRDISLYLPPETPIFKTHLVPSGVLEGVSGTPVPPESLRNQDIWAVCGIAYPESFLETLTDLGVRITGVTPFPDHYPYTRKDLEQIASQAERKGIKAIITTEKDWVKWAGKCPFQRVYVVSVEQKFVDEEKFYAFLDRFVYNTSNKTKGGQL